MDGQRDIRADGQSDRMDRVIEHGGFFVAEGESIEDRLRVGADLLRSEGIDIAWPPVMEADGPAYERERALASPPPPPVITPHS